ncbi:hypothetical protein B4U79_18212 [Dinothrombium tinctorium]|uniref:Peptidase M12B domain-containing protein n=1 Tax=Dinothrombium tinctorium TaxID=1965070 RepID=A0A3S3S0H8_9ACAR|nr:hypothetical protein B4U79_18212 [Dinothrombium tinctorium]
MVETQNVGLANVPAVCTKGGLVMVEAKSYTAVNILAHEIGHAFNMLHDGDKGNKDCDSRKYIMAPASDVTQHDWSSCSFREIRRFMDTDTSNCLFTQAGTESDPLPHLGLDLQEQCEFAFGPNFKALNTRPYQRVCKQLYCEGDFFIIGINPALDNSTCRGAQRDGRCCKGLCFTQQSFCE